MFKELKETTTMSHQIENINKKQYKEETNIVSEVEKI
jgi:hypothetical protein